MQREIKGENLHFFSEEKLPRGTAVLPIASEVTALRLSQAEKKQKE